MENMFLLCQWVDLVCFGGHLHYKVNKNEVTTFDAWLQSLICANVRNKLEKKNIKIHVEFTCLHI